MKVSARFGQSGWANEAPGWQVWMRHQARVFRWLASRCVGHHLRDRYGSRQAGVDLGDEVGDGDRLVAVRAWSPRSEPSSKDDAFVATLLSEQPCFTFGALVHDAGSRQTPSQAELELIHWLLAPTKAALTAGI